MHCAADPRAVDEFITRAEALIAAQDEELARTSWVYSTFMTSDTQWLATKVRQRATETAVNLAAQASRLDTKDLSELQRRRLELIRRRVTLPAPAEPVAAAELATLSTRLASAYSTATVTLNGRTVTQNEVEGVMRELRDPAQLATAWERWHAAVRPMAADYTKLVQVANSGARQLGYADVGAMWRSGYDMGADEFSREIDRLWRQVRPLYEQLHCHTRAMLNSRYGNATVPLAAPIRADLLGNMWAQEWTIEDIVIPDAPNGAQRLTATLQAQGYDARRIVRTAEGFFTSLGFAPLPATFWQRSQFTQPADRNVVCHASAANPDGREDLRVKLCLGTTATDFMTAHHELGHVIYSRAYNSQPVLFRTGANDAFHEALGDLMILSITPAYLQKLGLYGAQPQNDIAQLQRLALDRLPLLPFSLLMDKWRWQVFANELTPATYNDGWWRLRREYQGVRPPVDRSATDFDPGAKYHIAANVPYARYFLARILQFQLYKAACDTIGWRGPLHQCSFHDSREVGRKLQAMLAMGASRPWPDALESFTGSRRIDGAALLAYFEPLSAWLEEQNAGRQCGW